jgi:hypothetical protein
MFADIPALSDSFSCVSPSFSRCLLMLPDRVFRNAWALSFIFYGYGIRLRAVFTPDIHGVRLDIPDFLMYIDFILGDTVFAVMVYRLSVLFNEQCKKRERGPIGAVRPLHELTFAPCSPLSKTLFLTDV